MQKVLAIQDSQKTTVISMFSYKFPTLLHISLERTKGGATSKLNAV
jgi:hypothetical protein